MKAKHTPGPWEVRWWAGRCTTVVGRQRPPICDTSTTIKNVPRDEANARLIAAAPELLKVLKEVMSWEENAQMTWAPAARAAINKAEGAES